MDGRTHGQRDNGLTYGLSKLVCPRVPSGPPQATALPPTRPLRDLSPLIAAGRPNLRVGRHQGGP